MLIRVSTQHQSGTALVYSPWAQGVGTAVDVEAELQERRDGREMEVEDKGGRSVLDTGVPLYILIIHEPFAQGILCCLTSRAHELVGRVRSYADVVGL